MVVWLCLLDTCAPIIIFIPEFHRTVEFSLLCLVFISLITSVSFAVGRPFPLASLLFHGAWLREELWVLE